MKYLLDTCVVSELIKKNPNKQVVKWISKTTETNLFISVLTIGELHKGIEKLPEGWYKKSLKIDKQLGDEHGAAITYHQLGRIAQERKDFEKAEDWYKKSLKIEEQLGNEHGAAITYWQLGLLAMLEGRVEDSGRWSVKGIAAFSKTRDPDRANQAINTFHIAYQQASQSEQRKLKQCWENAGLGPLPDVAARE